jgi:hypothetical protein
MYREAEIAAMKDVPEFIRKAQEIYGYDHFVNDVGGSLCELEDDSVIDLLAEHTLILYIQVTTKDEEDTLIRRAQSDPKPLYYRPAFLAEHLPVYMAEKGLEFVAQVEPNDFTRWVFPRLFHSRVPALRGHRRPARLHRDFAGGGPGEERGGFPGPGRDRHRPQIDAQEAGS